MKKLLFLLCISTFSLSILGQAKKPTLMVIPADTWCTNNSFMDVYDNQGSPVLIPNYQLAIQMNTDLVNVISKINILMTDRGFPLKDLSQSLKSINRTKTENSLITSKNTGAALAESPLDQIKNVAKSDIILEVDWSINSTGPKKSITYNLRGLDAYTGKQIAGAQGTGTPSFSAEVPVLLEEAIRVNMDNFVGQLQSHFDDILENGREATVAIQVFDEGTGIDLETEYDGYELTEIIDNWMAENTVNHRFSKSDGTENFILFEQVRIPLYKSNGMAMDTDAFVRELRRFLRAAPYKLESKVVNQGLGRATLVIGQK